MKSKALIGLLALVGLTSVSHASLVYAVDVRNQRFLTFDTLTPGTQTVLATGYNTPYFGLDFNAAATNLYGIRNTVTGGPMVLDQLSLANGSVLGSVGITGHAAGAGITGLAFDSANNAYMSTFTTGIGSELYSLNTTTGAASLIGNMHATNIVIDISVSSTGQMVAHDISTDAFHNVNTGTGAMTLIGNHGLAANFAQGMDFDWSNNTLYAAVYTGGGTLTYGSVNLGTGAVTSIPGILSGEYEMAVQQAVPEPASLAALGLGALALLRRRKKTS